jgi:hypothetical protein
MPTPDLQVSVKFNPQDARQIVTNGQDRVVFWSWEEGKVRGALSLWWRDCAQSLRGSARSMCAVPVACRCTVACR